ncbi:hypothetical protein ELI55_24645 [Rhizobium ruizarguesonis]|uniref:hypothetical protein n=1 Tax=Rhizobium ruizarguesonis TaxID=2081791 RepID=UPI00102F7B1B|nr:hypothetical protein [Rhizobium ruizarguesonis]TAU07813.1 hypothetical protein ELI55_24645 [Rhizobium ruizarguesonis]
MPFRPERKQAIRVPIGQVFEDILAFSDIETLALQLPDDGFGQLVQNKSRILPTLSGCDHLPEQHPRQIVTKRPTSGLGRIPHPLLPGDLFCAALFLRFPRHCLPPCCGASASVPATQGTSGAAYVDISDRKGRIVSNRQPDLGGLQTRSAGIADRDFGNDKIGTGIAEG